MNYKLGRVMDEFVPDTYYYTWANEMGIDLMRYPYIFMDYDPSLGKRVPHAVFNFYVPTVDDQRVAAAVIVYKSVHSKSQFRRLIYL